MKSVAMALAVLLGLALMVSGAAKEKITKPWTEWTVKDASKVLDDSPWGQVQTETDTTETTWSTASRPIEGRGAVDQATGVNFRIRFISAKPIRQAFLRLMELDPANTTPQKLEQARQFMDRKFDQTIVIAVMYDGKDTRFTGPVFQAFNSAVTSTLKNNTYLDVRGKRVFLQEYQPPPGANGFGATFIFPRMVDDKPVIDAKSGDVRFYAEFSQLMGNNQQVKLNMRFKVADMLYGGVLEF